MKNDGMFWKIEKKRAFFIDESGYTTVEATFIISFFIFVMVAVIYLTFFLYDKCALERACNMAALRGSQAVWEDNSIRYQRAEEGIRDILANNLLGIREVEQKISIEGDRVSVCLSAEFKWWKLEVEEEKRVINPVKFVRNCRKAEGVIKD